MFRKRYSEYSDSFEIEINSTVLQLSTVFVVNVK